MAQHTAIEIPKWLTRYLRPHEISQIEKAIASAEKNTSAELVPMIVASSSDLTLIPVVVFLLLTTFLFAGFIILGELGHLPNLWWVGLGLILTFALASFLARLSFVIRLFLPRRDRATACLMRAEREFFKHHLHNTQDSTGVLILVSLLEHQVVVYADQTICVKLSSSTWLNVVNTMLTFIKQKQMHEAFIRGINIIGTELATHFPAKATNHDELRNTLIISE